MRDLTLTLVFAALLGCMFKHPVIGAYLWAWFSLMNPHKMTYGFAFSLPFAQIIALITLVALLFTRQRRALPLNGITLLWLALVVWMGVTSVFALNDPAVVFDRWLFVFKIHLMLLASLMLIVNIQQFKLLVVIVTLSVAFFGIKGGVFTLATGGGYIVWGPPGGMLGGNNEAAVGFVTLVPFLFWMRHIATRPWLKRGLTLSIVLMVFAILGSQSRGALLAIFAMGLFLGLKSNHPFRVMLLMMVGLALAVAFMPETWTARMDTIGTYQEDSSAMSRLWTWTTLWNAAVDRPLVGAGYRADSIAVFQRYAPVGGKWAAFESLSSVWVAHSIYFQMLGEHGFVGLGLYLALWLTAWLKAGRLARQAELIPSLSAWLPMLMRMTQVGLIGFAVGGAFLSLAYLDLPFYFMGYVILAQVLVSSVPVDVAARPSTSRQGRPVQSGAGSGS